MENKTIDKIFFDNNKLMEKIKPTDKYLKLMSESTVTAAPLLKEFSAEQKSIFDRIIELQAIMEGEATERHFIAGLKLGFRLAVECLYD